jgi:HSP20 family protein
MRQAEIWETVRRNLSEVRETVDGVLRKVRPLSSLLLPYPAVDLYETDEAVIVRADVPGVRKESLGVSVLRGTLVIEGRREETEPEGCVARCREREVGQFRRQIELPVDVDEEAEPAATLENGVLTVTLKKKPRPAGRTIRVEVR